MKKRLFNKFLPLLMLIVCSILGTTDAWASWSHSTHHGKVTVAASGSGSVYIGTTNSATLGKTEETWNCSGQSSGDTKTYYLFATPDAANHYYFEGWSGSGKADGVSSTNNPYQISPKVDGGSSSSPQTWTYTANFKLLPKFYFAAGAEVDPAGNGTGKVVVAYSSTEPAAGSFSASSAVAKTDVWADTKDDGSKTATAYYFAKADAGMTFMGWYDENGVQKTTNTTYSVQQTSTTKADDATPEVYYARFRDPSIKFDPSVELVGQDGATEVTIKVDDEQSVSFVNVDDAVLSTLNAPSIAEVSRVDVGSDPIVVWDAANRKLTANRAGTATVTFSHPATDGFNAGNFTFTIHVEKITPEFSWKTSVLLAGQSYTLKDLVETPSDGAWNIVSSKESVFASISQAGTQSATANIGTVTLTFSQGLSYKYNAIPAASQEFKVYTNEGFATYKVGSSVYTDLGVAISEANKLSKDKYIFVNQDGAVIPGNYTIPSGVTLVVPHESTYSTNYITSPSTPVNSTEPIHAFRTLRLIDGVNITVNGAISVSGQVQSGDASHNPCGFPVGAVGCIDMSTGGHIHIGGSGTLYVWGFIKGQGYLDGNNTQNVGKVTTEYGSTIWECFGMADFGGGSFAKACTSGKGTYHLFPFRGYYVQNIEVPLYIEYGANEKLFTCFYFTTLKSTQTANFAFMGNADGVLFRVSSTNGQVVKWYDPTTDHVVIQLVGDAKLDNLKLNVGESVQSKDYDLPLLNNMHIKLKDCNLDLPYSILLQPNCIFEIMKGSALNLNSGSHFYLYDHDQWGKYTGLKTYFCPTPTVLSPHFSRGNGSENTLDDARLIVDGEIIINGGGLHTTASGADIMGNGGGSIQWKTDTISPIKTIYGYTAGNSVTGNTLNSSLTTTSLVPSSTNSAWMHNDNGTYTAPISRTTFDNVHGRWFKRADAKERDDDHTYNFTYINGDNTAATAKSVYSADKTGLTAGYKWVNVTTDSEHANTFLGEDGNLYNWTTNSEWLQLVATGDGTYAGSDDNLYTYADGAWHKGTITIGDDCLYDFEGTKKALVGKEFIAITHDEYDEVFVDASGNYYMLFDGCVWQHAEKVPNTYKAYVVLGNYYVWIDNAWTEVGKENDLFYTTDDQNLKHYYEYDGAVFAWVPVQNKVRISNAAGEEREFRTWDDAMLYTSQYNDPTITLLGDVDTRTSFTMIPNNKTTNVIIDLNGHTVSGTVAQVINFNGAGKTLTITDNSDDKKGQIRTVYKANAVDDYAIKLMAGTINWEHVSLYAHNTWAGESAYGNARSGGVYIAGTAGNVFNLKSGAIETHSDKAYAYGVYNLANSVFNMSGGIIKTHAGTTTSYGVLDYGSMNMSGGEVEAIANQTTSYGVYVNAANATLNMTGGSVTAEAKAVHLTSAADANAYAVHVNNATAKATVSNATISAIVSNYGFGQNARAINTVAGANVTLNSGTVLNAEAYKNAYGVVQASSAATQSTSVLTINEGVTVNAKARTYAFGVQGYGNMTINAATINAQTCELGGLPGTTYAYGIYAHASPNATAANSYYSVLKATNCKINVKASTVYGYGYFVLGTSANSTTAVDGTWSNKASARATITGGTVNVDCGNSDANSYAYGIWSRAGVDENGTQDAVETVIKNVTIKAHGTHRYVYGIFAAADAADYTGGCTRGNVIVDGVDVTATSDYTSDSYAYGAYVQTSAIWINRGKYKKDVATNSTNKKTWYVPADPDDDDISHEALNGTTSNTNIYRIGEYAVGAKLVINGGTFRANTTVGSHAFGVQNSRAWSYNRNKVAYGDLIINGGTFVANTNTTNAMGIYNFGNTTINGGTFTGNTTTTTAYGAYGVSGTMQINAGTFNANATTTTAYGIAANGTIDGNYCFVDEGVVTVEDGVEVNVKSLGGATAYGVYVTGVTKDYTQATYDGRSASNKEYYYFSELDGTVLTHGTKGDAFRIVKGQFSASGKVIVNGGTFNVNAYTTDAYGVDVISARTVGTATTYPKAEIYGGFFNVTSGTPASAFAAKLDGLKDYSVIKGGHFNVRDNLTSSDAKKNYVNAPYYVLDCNEDIYKTKYPYEVAQAYTITFKDDADNELWSNLLPADKPAMYPVNGGVAEKTSTPSASYEFIGWTDGVNTYAIGTPLPNVTEDATYTAQFNEVAKRYLVTWYDDNNVEIDHMEWASGAMPTHAIPYKEGYTFSHWMPAISAVDGEPQVYHAVFTPNKYTIIWLDENGNQLQQESLNYGATPSFVAPEKDGYTFYRWEPALETVSANATYQAAHKQNIASVTTATGIETVYTSFATALAETNKLDGATLKLLADVSGLALQTIKVNMTLDLNGHTLSGPGGKAVDGTYALLCLNTAGKVLTITDNSRLMSGTVNTTVNVAARQAAVYVSNGKVVLDKGTLHAENLYTTVNTNYRALGIFAETSGSIEVNGGVIEAISSSGYSYGVFAKSGTLSIKDCQITSRAQQFVRGLYTQVNASIQNVVINVEATNAAANTTANVGAYGIYCDATGGAQLMVDNVTIIAQSPKLEAYGLNLYSNNTGTLSNLKIQAKTAPIDTDAPTTLKITSGFFDKETNVAKYIGTKKLVPLTVEPEKAEGYNYKMVDNAYTITFQAEDGTTLQTSLVEAGARPVFADADPTKPSNPKKSYEFVGWSDGVHTYATSEIPAATANATYKATFEEHGVLYPITFANIDGVGGTYTQYCEYGVVPVYGGVIPSMRGNVGEGIAYIFGGWTPALVEVSKATTYTATFRMEQSMLVTYNMKGRGDAVAALRVAKGAGVPRPADQLTNDGYHITGWYKDEALANEWDFTSDVMGEEDLTLYAKWEKMTYTITWLDENDALIDNTQVEWGARPTHADLTKTPTPQYNYEFVGWNKERVAAYTDATYKSLGFKQVLRSYTVTFDCAGASAVDPIQVPVGTIIPLPADPTKEHNNFIGWANVPMTMPAENITLTAQWESQIKITWVVGSISTDEWVNRNASLAASGKTMQPSQASTASKTYSFNGWKNAAGKIFLSSQLPIATENATYTSQGLKEYTRQYLIEYDDNYTGQSPTNLFRGFVGDRTSAGVTYHYDAETGFVTENGILTTNTTPIVMDLGLTTGDNVSFGSYDVSGMYNTLKTTDASASTSMVFEMCNKSGSNPSTRQNSGVSLSGVSNLDNRVVGSGYNYFKLWTWYNKDKTSLEDAQYRMYFYKKNTSAAVAWPNWKVVNHGATIGTLLAAPTRDGYEFVGWFDAPNGGNKIESTTVVTSDMKIYAHWGKRSNLTWNYNGGTAKTAGTAAGSVLSGSVLTAPVVEKTGYTFAGWTPSVPSTMPGKDVTYTAQWTPKQYTISYDANYEGASEINETTTVTYDQKVGTLVTAPQRRYRFLGWLDKDGTPYTAETIYKIDGDLTLYADWESYVITYRNWDGSLLASFLQAYNEDPEPIDNPSRPDDDTYTYTFSGWSPELGPVINDQTYTAQFEAHAKSQTVTEIVAGDGNKENEHEPVALEVQTTTENVTIKEDGEIVLSENATLTVTNDFVLTADAALAEHFEDAANMPDQAGASGQITFPEGYNASQESAALTTQANVYFDLNIDIKKRTWYAVSVPWQVDANTGIAIKGEKTLSLGVDEDITYYDGAARAQYGPVTAQTVKYLEDIPVAENRIMQPGTMYFLYFAKDWPNATIRFTKKSGTNTVYTGDVNVVENASSTGNGGDGGWNGISNPKIYSAYVDAGVEYGYIFVGGEYVRITLAETKFAVGTPVMVQAEEEKTVVINRTQSNPATAPMRVRALDPIKLDVFISGVDGRATDRLTLKATDEEKADEYVIGLDLAKMSVSTKKAQMWVNRYANELTVNTQMIVGGTAEYPLVMKVPAAGEYTISLANMPSNANVYLTYEGMAIWDLSMGNYPVDLPQGNTTEYGIRINTHRVTTGMDEAIVNSQGKTQKIMVNGILYIVRGGQVYDAKGKQIK